WYGAYGATCDHCANVDQGDERVTRGGSVLSTQASDLSSTARGHVAPSERSPAVGIRCARDE
ncbi:MAG TPA: SUMF1/EgtB/PvdO family nonheme iron enzyme, partial [Polyangiaceae bacterium]